MTSIQDILSVKNDSMYKLTANTKLYACQENAHSSVKK